MRFHLAHILPGDRFSHGLQGYKEVIDTVQWGLTKLGHTVTYGVNDYKPDARNIVFGAQVLPVERQDQLPPDTIVYNFEQMRGGNPAGLRHEMVNFAKKFQIWDFSPFNVESWDKHQLAHPVRVVPVGYAPVLERIPKASSPEIDALIYGYPNPDRLKAFNELCYAGLASVFLCGLYGQARDKIVGRSRAVLNLSLHQGRIFEVVRVSYLLANRKAVVAMVHTDTVIEPGFEQAVVFTEPRRLQKTMLELAGDGKLRAELEERGYQAFKKRDIRQILQQELEA